MTHNDLLALINDEIEVCEPECNQHQRINAPWLALRAVVELHKPHEHIQEYGSGGLFCFACQLLYPCFTIQAIEKELS